MAEKETATLLEVTRQASAEPSLATRLSALCPRLCW